MLGIASRFRPWGRPFAPYDLQLVATHPADLTGLSVEEETTFDGPTFFLTNHGTTIVVTYATTVLINSLNNLLSDGLTNASDTLAPGQSQSVTPRFRPPNAGPFSAWMRLQFRFTAYAPEAWAAHNSTDTDFLNQSPAYKVSRSVILSPQVNLSGSASRDD